MVCNWILYSVCLCTMTLRWQRIIAQFVMLKMSKITHYYFWKNHATFVEETLIISTMLEAFKCFATESCIQLIWIFCDEICQKSHRLSCRKCQKSRIICYAKNVENPTTFVEGFWPEFYKLFHVWSYWLDRGEGHRFLHNP